MKTCINCHLPKTSKCQNEMFCFSRLMSPPSKCCYSVCIVSHYTVHRQMHACAQTHTNCISKITSLPRRCLKITSVPHRYTNHSLGLLFFSPSPLTPSFAFPHYFRLFPPLYSALNCQAWIALWTAWGGQASRRCVWMHESLCYHHLFSFSSPSDAVRSQTRYHSPAIPPNPPNRESQHNVEELE